MADAAYFVSKSQRDYYIKEFHIRDCSKLQVVYNGIDFEKLDATYPKPDFLESGKSVGLAMVGNFVRVRAQIVIAKSIQILKQQGVTDFDFYFVGRRDDAEPWRYDECVRYCEEQGMNDCVHFVGGRGDVPAILQNIDGFVYATNHDTFGIAVVEAMAAGLPVVVNDWGVMREVCGEENHAIRYYKTGDPIDCAKTIKHLLETLAEFKTEAKENAKMIREKYAIQEHMLRLAAVYGANNG
jgi:glycosyltransferase involved in cell wall biosynthesis